MKTATLTFHASHNYGSMLQAYALQQTLFSLGVENEIVNLRIDSQKQMYARPRVASKKFILAKTLRGLQKKHDLFEDFLKGQLKLTREISDPSELGSLADSYDLFIAGSDQIWNPECTDFTFAYFMPFADKRISYATSFGPHGKAVWQEAWRIKPELLKYKAISVREQGSADIVERLTGIGPEILPDPVVLPGKAHWEAFAGENPIREGRYIFTYHPFPRHGFAKLSEKAGKMLGLDNVTSLVKPTLASVMSHRRFEKKLDCGSKEFLNLIRHSELVISGSFHAVLFAILFERPFFAVCGKGDNRISHLLKVTGLEERMCDEESLASSLGNCREIDFSKAREALETLRGKGIDYLKKHCAV